MARMEIGSIFSRGPPRTHALLEIFDGSRGWRIIGKLQKRSFSFFILPMNPCAANSAENPKKRLGTRQSRGCLDGLSRVGITSVGASKHPLLTEPKLKMDESWKSWPNCLKFYCYACKNQQKIIMVSAAWSVKCVWYPPWLCRSILCIGLEAK